MKVMLLLLAVTLFGLVSYSLIFPENNDIVLIIMQFPAACILLLLGIYRLRQKKAVGILLIFASISILFTAIVTLIF